MSFSSTLEGLFSSPSVHTESTTAGLVTTVKSQEYFNQLATQIQNQTLGQQNATNYFLAITIEQAFQSLSSYERKKLKSTSILAISAGADTEDLRNEIRLIIGSRFL